MGIFSIITRPLGWILSTFYSFTGNYGIAILLFTLVTKLVLLPLAIKQQKSAAQMAKVQPLLAKLQKKYANDKEKLSQETMKVYKEQKVNPLASCLPMLIQIPIVLGLFRVINQPLTYIMHLAKDQVFAIYEYLTNSSLLQLAGVTAANTQNFEIPIARAMSGMIQTISEALNIPGLHEINFKFLGFLDLAARPAAPSLQVLFQFEKLMEYLRSPELPLLIIPLLAMVTTYFQSKVTPTATAGGETASATQMMSSMTVMLPIMTGVFSFMMPAGVGFYWVCSTVFQIAQQLVLNKIYSPSKEGGNIKVEKIDRANGQDD